MNAALKPKGEGGDGEGEEEKAGEGRGKERERDRGRRTGRGEGCMAATFPASGRGRLNYPVQKGANVRRVPVSDLCSPRTAQRHAAQGSLPARQERSGDDRRNTYLCVNA